MKNILKKLVSVFAAVTIAFSAVSGVYAQSTDDGYNAGEAAYELIAALKITDGKERNMDEIVTRAEFCDMTSRLMKNDFTVKDYYYTDVPPSHEYAKAVYTLSELGIVNGTEGGRFEPDKAVTANQAGAILVKALNWYATLKQPAKYPDDYIYRAYKLGLFSGVKTGGENELTFYDACIIMYNALQADVAIFENNELNTSYKAFESFQGLNYDTGICTANSITTLSGSKKASLKGNQLEINGVRYDLLIGNAGQYIGMNLEFYYDDDKNIVFLRPYKNRIISVDYEDAVDLKVNHFEYYDGSNRKSVAIESSADLIFNGVSYPSYNPDEFDFKNSSGTVTLIDNSGDRRYDCIVIEEYKTCVINYADEANKVLYYSNYKTEGYDAPGASPERYISFKNADTVEIIRTDGEKVPFNQLFTNDVASVFMSKDESYAKIIVSPQKLYGTISAVENDKLIVTAQDGTEGVYEIDSNDKSVLNVLKLGYSGGFLINHRGKICGVMNYFGDEYAYGYLIKTHRDKTGLDNKLKVKILNADGKVYIYDFDEKTKIDGTRYSSYEDAEAALSLYDSKAGKYYTNQQLIRYKYNAVTNTVNYIDTAVLGSGESKDTSLEMVYYSDKEYRYRPNNRYLNRKLVIDVNGLVVFCVPRVMNDSSNPSDIMYADDEDYFVKYDIKGFAKKEYVRLDAALTDKDGGSTTCIVCPQEYSSGISVGGNSSYKDRGTLNTGIVDSIGSGINSEGEDVPVLKVICETNVISVPCKYKECIKKSVYDDEGNVTDASVLIERGDAVEFYTDENGNAGYVNVIYDISRTDNKRFYAPGENVINKDDYSCGIIYSKSPKAMKMMRLYDGAPRLDLSDALASFNPDDYAVQTIGETNLKIFVYNSEDDEVRKGTVYDIRDYVNNPSNPSIVIQKESYTIPSVLYIYN